MNLMQRYKGDGSTVLESIQQIKFEMHRDIVGIWSLVAKAKHGFQFIEKDIKEFIYLSVKYMMEDGGIVVESSQDKTFYYQRATRFGSTPDEIARNVVAEWVAQGEPEINGYEGIAFVDPEYLTSEDNIRPPGRR